MKTKKFIVVRSAFGHEIMALNFAKALNMPVVVIPNKEKEEEYEAESEKILANMSFLSNDIVRIPFADHAKYEALSYDIIADLKAGKLADEIWEKFVTARLVPTQNTNTLPQFAGMRANRKNLLLIPQKLISDGECGVTAQQQSLSPEVFNFLKEQNEY